MPDRRLPFDAIPQDTCPLCRRRALGLLPAAAGNELICTCGYCGSQFAYDSVTGKSRYMYVAPEFNSVAGRLVGQPLSRRETFEAVDAATAVGERRRRQALPSGFFWLILIGVMGVLAITCACSAALALGPSMAYTRRQIASVNTAQAAPLALAAPITPATQQGDGEDQAGAADAPPGATAADSANAAGGPGMPAQATGPIDPLQSPLQPPAADGAATPGGSVILATAIAPEQQIELPPPPTPTDAVSAFPQPGEAKGTPTLPPTFTTVPTDQNTSGVFTTTPDPGAAATVTPTATLSAETTPSVTPTATTTPTATLTPTVSLTQTGIGNIVTGTIAISTVLYLGSGMSNEADEYVEVVNRSGVYIGMSNWTLRSVVTKQVYLFPNGFVMLPDQVCRVYTNNPVPYGQCGSLMYGSPSPVWDNNGDVAELLDANGVLVSKYAYGTPPAGP